jgi:hypothetical protein
MKQSLKTLTNTSIAHSEAASEAGLASFAIATLGPMQAFFTLPSLFVTALWVVGVYVVIAHAFLAHATVVRQASIVERLTFVAFAANVARLTVAYGHLACLVVSAIVGEVVTIYAWASAPSAGYAG